MCESHTTHTRLPCHDHATHRALCHQLAEQLEDLVALDREVVADDALDLPSVSPVRNAIQTHAPHKRRGERTRMRAFSSLPSASNVAISRRTATAAFAFLFFTIPMRCTAILRFGLSLFTLKPNIVLCCVYARVGLSSASARWSIAWSAKVGK